MTHHHLLTIVLICISLTFVRGQIDPTLTFDDLTVTYGDADFDLSAASDSDGTISYTIDGGDIEALTLSGTNGETVTILSVGTVILRADQSAGTGFNPGSESMTLTINQATLTVVAQDFGREYGEDNPTVTVFEYRGFKNGDGTDGDTDISGLLGQSGDPTGTIAASATVAANVPSTHAITVDVSALSSTNYDFAADNTGEVTITQATLTVIGQAISREYGEDNPPFTVFEYSGFKNGEGTDGDTDISGLLGQSGSPSGSSTASLTSNAGSAQTIDVDVSGLSATNYNFDDDDNGVLTINQATLAVIAQAISREYGEDNPTFLTFEYSGFKNGEATDGDTDISGLLGQSGSPSGSSTASRTSNVGSAQSIDVDVSGLSATNYDFADNDNGVLTIDQAILTVVAQDFGREYGENNPTATVFEYSGFKNGDGTDGDTDISGLLGQTGSPTGTIAASATTTANVPSTHAITVDVSALSSTNYDFAADNTGEVTITQATLTVIGQAISKEYGEDNPTFTVFEYSGFKNGEGTDGDTDISGLLGQSGSPSGSSTASRTSNVGSAQSIDVDVSGLSATNYDFADNDNGVLTIDQAILTVVAQDFGREYGENNPTVTVFEYRGFKNGDGTDGDTDISGLLGQTGSPTGTIAASATTTANVPSTHAITVDVSALSSTNYDFAADNTGEVTITQATLTVIGQAISKEYGEDNPPFTVFEYSGFKNGEGTDGDTDISGLLGQSGSPSGSSTASRTSNVGSAQSIDVDVSGLSATNYDFADNDNGVLTIDQAILTVVAQDFGREYGENNPTVTVFEYRGFKNGDGTDGDTDISGLLGQTGSPTGTIAASATTTANVPSTHAITVDVSALSSTNYDFAADNTGEVTITQATLTVIGQAISREYGEDNPPFTVFEYSGFKNGEGTDGDTDISGLLGQSGSPSGSSTASLTSNAGSAQTIDVDVSGLSATNYNFDDDDNGVLTINQATLAVIAQAISREYGEDNPTFLTFEYSGFKNGEATDGDTDISGLLGQSGSPSGSSTASRTSNVGSAQSIDVDVSGLSATNYDFADNDNGVLTIDQAILTVVAQDFGREYGENNPTVTVFEYSGFKNGDGTDGDTDISGLLGQTGSPTGTIAASATTTANVPSTHAITVDVSALSSTNYDFAADNTGEVTITQATLTVIGQAISKEYGEDNPTFTVFEYSGFKNGEGTDGDTDISGLLGQSGSPSGSSTASRTSNVGSAQSIDVDVSGLSATNYDFADNDNGVLTIDQAILTVVAQDFGREYGENNPTVTVFEYRGFKNGDGTDGDTDISGLLGQTGSPTGTIAASATTTANVPSTHAITVDVSALSSTNYDFAADNTGEVTITQATLTVIGQAISKEYGEDNPPFTVFEYSGFKNGEGTDGDTDISGLLGQSGSPSGSSTASRTSNVGSAQSIDVDVSGLSATNYDFADNDNGVLTIDQAILTVVAQDFGREYGENNPTVTVFEYRGFKNGDGTDGDTDISGLLGQTGSPTGTIAASATTTANVPSTHAITVDVSALSSTNYDFAADNTGEVTITQATLTVIGQAISKEYGEDNPTFTVFEYSGFKNGEGTDGDTDISGLLGQSGSPSGSSTASLTSNAGSAQTIDVDVSGLSATNYNFDDDDNGILTINQATLTVVAQNFGREYGEDNPTVTVFEYRGFKNGDGTDGDTDISGLLGQSGDPAGTIAASATATANVPSTHAITVDVSALSSTNYDFAADNTGEVTITQATLTVIGQAISREYGEDNPPFTVFEYSGFKNGEGTDGDTDISGLLGQSGSPSGSSTAGIDAEVGSTQTIDVDISTLLSTNYNFNALNTGILEITPAPLTFRVPIEEIAFTQRLDTLLFQVSSITGFKLMQNEKDLDGSLSFDVDAGSYSFTTTETVNYRAAGYSSNNYEISYPSSPITIHRWPSVDLQPMDVKDCEGQVATFRTAGSADPSPIYEWLFRENELEDFRSIELSGLSFDGGATTSLSIDSLNISVKDFQFKVRISSPDGWGKPAESNIVMIDTLETPSLAYIHLKGSDLLINTDQGRAIYYWGVGTDTITDTNVNYLEISQLNEPFNNYWSIAQNQNGCATRSYLGQVSNPAEDIVFDLDFEAVLKPNPSNGNSVNIQFESSIRGTIDIFILNQLGTVIRSVGSFDMTDNNFESGPIELSDPLPTGIYIVDIQSEVGIRKLLRLIVL